MLSRVRRYLSDSACALVEHYEHFLASRFPTFYKVYEVFANGTKLLYGDVQLYRYIRGELNRGHTLRQFTLAEIDAYYSLPKDLARVAPFLVICALPFANYVLFPLALKYPHHLLSSHYWTEEQKLQHKLSRHKDRRNYYSPLMEHLRRGASIITQPKVQERLKETLDLIQNGGRVTPKKVLATRDAFREPPFTLCTMSPSHVSDVFRAHGLPYWRWGRRGRLRYHAYILRELDYAMLREGIGSLSGPELRDACFRRGLDPRGLTPDFLAEWLRCWLHVSEQTDEDDASLLLHCPVLLSYSGPVNRGDHFDVV